MQDKVTGFTVACNMEVNELATSIFTEEEEILLPVVLL